MHAASSAKLATHPKVDSDGHVFEPADLWQRYLPAALRDRGPKPVSNDVMQSSSLIIDGKRMPRYEIGAKVWTEEQKERYRESRKLEYSVHSQVAGMDVEGIDAAIVFPTRGLLVMGVDGVDPKITTASADAYNQWLCDYTSGAKGRLFGAGMIDPRDVPAARRQARECVEKFGFPAVFLRPNPVNNKHWSDPVYDPLWSDLEDLDLPVCFHEGSTVMLPQVATERYPEHAFWHACNHPMEQQMAMMSMLLGGVAARHPKLKLAFLESGAGWLPYWLWRLDEHYENEQRKFPELKMLPSEYCARQCFISIDSDETPGMAAMELAANRVVWGSDYPHPDAKFPNALRMLANLKGMSPQRLKSVVWDAPSALYGPRLTEHVRAAGPKAAAA